MKYSKKLDMGRIRARRALTEAEKTEEESDDPIAKLRHALSDINSALYQLQQEQDGGEPPADEEIPAEESPAGGEPDTEEPADETPAEEAPADGEEPSDEEGDFDEPEPEDGEEPEDKDDKDDEEDDEKDLDESINPAVLSRWTYLSRGL